MKAEIGDFVHGSEEDKERTVKVSIDPWDTWNLDNTIALVVAPLLKRFREDSRKIPGDLYHEIEENYSAYKEAFTEEEFEKHVEETATVIWNEYLDEMIWAFEEAGENYMSLTGVNGNDYDKYQMRLQNGFQLFGKYYMSLWI